MEIFEVPARARTSDLIKEEIRAIRETKAKLVAVSTVEVTEKLLCLEREFAEVSLNEKKDVLDNLKNASSKLGEILALSMRIQTKGFFTVFCDYSGHVQWLGIRVYRGRDYQTDWFRRTLNIDEPGSQRFDDKVEEILTFLRTLDETNEEPADGVSYDTY